MQGLSHADSYGLSIQLAFRSLLFCRVIQESSDRSCALGVLGLVEVINLIA